MSTTATTPFAYGDHKVRTTLTEDGEALFVLTDLCRILGLRNSRSVATRLDEDCLGVRLTDTKRGKRKLTFVNEAASDLVDCCTAIEPADDKQSRRPCLDGQPMRPLVAGRTAEYKTPSGK
ncbi:BRO-N domain-containing protein [Actinomyces bowdenii]|uniref:Bro-N domain-containing protein n=1 Tax=Actinomyces bowdenii TaxID=131109 RepID=A0A853EMH5_9ACTO|nr:Bro-N domain-containing protein [Actinomyces bowdenii]MBF0697289.1 Bro-N domain-containing protein [Actinomyces bowdenii]NYS69462.1 Bro-N domain-containing protein [Actinomyces bowdenii]